MKPIRVSVKILKKIKKYSKKNSLEVTMNKICDYVNLLEVKQTNIGTGYELRRVEHLWRSCLFIFYTQGKLKKRKEREYVIKYLEIGSKKKRKTKNYFDRNHSTRIRNKIKRSVLRNRYNKDI